MKKFYRFCSENINDVDPIIKGDWQEKKEFVFLS